MEQPFKESRVFGFFPGSPVFVIIQKNFVWFHISWVESGES
jgi:hypothetical protein